MDKSADCCVYGNITFFDDGTPRRLHGNHTVTLFQQVIQPAVQGAVTAPCLLQQLFWWIGGMGGPGTALADVKRSRLGNVRIVIEADMRIRCIDAGLPLPEFVR